MRSCLRPRAETLPYARSSLEHAGIVRSRARADDHARLRHFNAKSKTAPRQALVTASTQAVTLSRDSETDAASLVACVPQHLCKYVAKIKVSVKGTPVQVYILGLSHVSRQSCDHAAQLIAAVTPEVVMLELCKDRVDLLVDHRAPPPQHWHSRIIDLQGMAQSSSVFNTCRKLLSSLTCQRGKSFTAYDIEQACIQLLSSGLFASVRPVTQPASTADFPLFLPGTHQVLTVALSLEPMISCHFTQQLFMHSSIGINQARIAITSHRLLVKPEMSIVQPEMHQPATSDTVSWYMPALHIIPLQPVTDHPAFGFMCRCVL